MSTTVYIENEEDSYLPGKLKTKMAMQVSLC
jgi:hypothetical protein